MLEPRGVSTHICCSGLCSPKPQPAALPLPSQNSRTQRVCTYSTSYLSVWATTEQVIWSVLKAEALLCFLNSPCSVQTREAVAGAGAEAGGTAKPAWQSAPRDWRSPPVIALQEQPVFFLHSGGRTAVRKIYCTAERCRGAGGPQGCLPGGSIWRGCQDAGKGQCRQVQAQWQAQQEIPHVAQSLQLNVSNSDKTGELITAGNSESAAGAALRVRASTLMQGELTP